MTRNEYYLCFKDSTTEVAVAMAETKNLDIVTQVHLLMESDDENDTGKLLALYKDANVEERAILDYLLVCLCGYTLGTVISFAEKQGCQLNK